MSFGVQASYALQALIWRREHRKQCEGTEKWSTCEGIWARLKAKPSGPALLSILLSNVCSLEGKLDSIRLRQTTQTEMKSSSMFVSVKYGYIAGFGTPPWSWTG